MRRVPPLAKSFQLLINAATGKVKRYFKWTVIRVVSMGRRNTRAEPTRTGLEGHDRSRALNRREQCPGWGLIEYRPRYRFSR